MTRVFYDTEFIETGTTIDLISIGMVTDDGREYYAVNGDLDDTTNHDPDLHGGYIGNTPWDRIMAEPWLVKNVVPSLPLRDRKQLDRHLNGVPLFAPRPVLDFVRLDHTHTSVKPRQVIANEVRDFLRAAGDDVELWAWYGAYDHVALCWLWGRMIELPDGVPMWTNDLRQERHRLGNPEMPTQAAGEHNALEDARHNLAMARFLDEIAERAAGDGPVRLVRAGWEVELDTHVERPPHVTFRRFGVTVVNGYVHPDATLSDFKRAPDEPWQRP
jgi:hypothetical protein